MNANEPVAWVKSETDEEGQYFVYREEEPKWLEGYIPLYTHPAKKKLNRMEVYELAIDSGFMLSTQYGQAENKLTPVSDGDTLVKLAEAILRKAQEK